MQVTTRLYNVYAYNVSSQKYTYVMRANLETVLNLADIKKGDLAWDDYHKKYVIDSYNQDAAKIYYNIVTHLAHHGQAYVSRRTTSMQVPDLGWEQAFKNPDQILITEGRLDKFGVLQMNNIVEA